ncbi:MAG TPA: hypothetical protein VJ998_07875 [Pseudomonadales bacterium]|nr:hypothetical protein [Pseudomonadales bacterium]
MFYKRATLALLIAGLSSTAFAACPKPSDPPTNFPDGAKASRAEMMKAKESVDNYVASARDFIDCVDTDEAAELKKIDADTKMDKDTKAEKLKAIQDRHEQRNKVVSQMQAIANRFNDEVHKFNKQ